MMKLFVLSLFGLPLMGNTATNWTKLSPSFEANWAHYLPGIPQTALQAFGYLVDAQGPFQVLSLRMLDIATLDGGADAVSRSICAPSVEKPNMNEEAFLHTLPNLVVTAQ